ncbi:MAG: GAF domain-containing protein [Anaerolineae bacterium]|nr:GAF domain-containing protein [Anaerolineae bacterium]
MSPSPSIPPSAHLAALASIASIVSQSLSLDETLQAALIEVLQVIGGQAGGICMVDKAAGDLVLRAHQGWTHDFIGLGPLRGPLDQGLAGEVMRTNAPVVSNQLNGLEAPAMPAFHDEHFLSIALAPMHARGQITGILSIMSREAGAFNQASVDLLASMADITGIALENARLYEESVAAQRRLNAVLMATADGILTTDYAGRIQIVNPAAERLLGTTASQLLNQPLSTAPLPSRLRFLAISATQSGGTLRSRALRVTLDEGRVISAVVLPIIYDQPDGASTRNGWLLLLQDITHLAEAEKARSFYLHAAAHDMRNPLSASIQSLALVRRLVKDPTPVMEEMLEIAQAGLGRIDHLIDEMLALEKIQNRSEFSAEWIEVGEFAFELRATAQALTASRGLSLRFWLGPAIPNILADRRILHMAILHYLENAVENAPAGSEVSVRLYREDNVLHVEVSDIGPSLPIEIQSRLFDRLAPLSLKDGPVTSVGLAIVKAAADAHGGSVYVQSGADEGSTFGLIVPLAPVAS